MTKLYLEILGIYRLVIFLKINAGILMNDGNYVFLPEFSLEFIDLF